MKGKFFNSKWNVIKTASKLLDKTPINYRLVRNMLMELEKETCSSKMKRVLSEIVVEGHRLKTNECDEEISEFSAQSIC